MIDKSLNILAPHLCYSCSKTGPVLCESCKNDIAHERFERCLACLRPVGERGVCQACQKVTEFSHAWCVGERTGVLERLIDGYKYQQSRAVAGTLVDILDEVLPTLPEGVVIVPLPTIRPHVRQRGFDHTLQLANGLARGRGIPVERLLVRANQTVQMGKTRAERLRQARSAYALKDDVSPTATYLLLDDIYTTGASVGACARILRDAGAQDVWVVVIARQTLD